MNDVKGTLEIDSPVGRLLLAACDDGLTHLLFVDREGKPLRAPHRPTGDSTTATHRILAETKKQCHRVIGRDRSLTGYGGGLHAKKTLLELEGAILKGDRLF